MAYVFEDRRQESNRRLESVRTSLSPALEAIAGTHGLPELAIYATGSLARREATRHSDLDAFFMLQGSEKANGIGRIRDVKIFHAVVVSAEEAEFPDFSNDGEYLRFLHVDDVVNGIGGRDDDYKNNFTARMLMMLESDWLYGKDAFESFQEKIISAYFEDFHDHSDQFRPLFLLNDVLRFWRTLCLNYENARNWRGAEDSRKSAKGHLGNLKLKFSRMNICFSFITHLMSQGHHLTLENAVATAKQSPLGRLQSIAEIGTVERGAVNRMLEEYDWFLRTTDKPKEEMLDWISNAGNREDAFRCASSFVEATGHLVRKVADDNGYLRYLIV